MTRKEAYEQIKNLNLQDEILSALGKNYTLCKTVDLEAYIQRHIAQSKLDENFQEEEVKETNTPQSVDNPYEAACLTFLGVLNDCGLLDDLMLKL